MKKRIIWIVKMATFYSLVGLFLQGLAVSILLASTPTEAQNPRDIKIKMNISDVTLAQAFQTIEKVTNYKFLYNSKEIPLNENTGNVNNESLYNILETFSASFGLTFNIINDQIVVNKSDVSTENMVTIIETGTIKGKITDASTKEALYGATVQIKGTTKGAMTDKNGYYELNNLKNGAYTVIASMIGYGKVEKTVNITGNKTVELNIQLEPKDIDMNEILVTASTVLPTPVKKLPNAITVITPREIENINAPNVADLIRLTVPGAVYRQEGPGATYGVFSVRGVASVTGAASTMKVYIDGVETTDPAYVTYLDPSTIERVEVVPGPQASTIYGAGAISGVMQIFTKHGTAGDVKLSGKVGMKSIEGKYVGNNSPLGQEYLLNASGSYSFFTYNLGVHYEKEAQWIKYFEENSLSLTASSNFKLGDLTGGLSLNLSNRDGSLGEDPIVKKLYSSVGMPYSSAGKPCEKDFDTYGLTLSYKATDNWTNNLTLGYNTNHYVTKSRTASNGLYEVNDDRSKRFTASYNTSYQAKLSEMLNTSLTVGTDWSQYSRPSFVGSVADVNSYEFVDQTPGYLINFGFYGQTQISLFDFVFLTGGLRADRNPSGSSAEYTWSPRLGLSTVYEIEKWMVKGRFAWGQSVILPDATAVTGAVSETSVVIANPDLQSEVQKGFEIGADLYYSNLLSIGITYFNQKPTNLIEMESLGSDTQGRSQYKYVNVDEVKNEGFEIKAVTHPWDWLTANVNFGTTRSTVSALGAGYTGTHKVGDKLAGEPEYTISINLEIMPFDGTSITLSAFQFGEWVNYDTYGFMYDVYTGKFDYAKKPYPSGYTMTYPSYTKINAGITQRVTKLLSAYLQVNNLNNTDRFERLNMIATQPRTIIFGIKFSGLSF